MQKFQFRASVKIDSPHLHEIAQVIDSLAKVGAHLEYVSLYESEVKEDEDEEENA